METPETKSPARSLLPTPPSSMTRLLRSAAQRNLRNQWSKLASYRKQWISSSSAGRSHATSLVNAYLSQKYMPLMELGALSGMPYIGEKLSWELFKQQELHRSRVLSSYKEMVVVIKQMVDASQSLRCFLKGASCSSLVQFSSSYQDNSDYGDGGGMPVFTFWSVSSFENLAEELVQMFKLELSLKRLLVLDLLSISCETQQINEVCWSDEVYSGEFNDLVVCNLCSKVNSEPVRPQLKDTKPDVRAVPGKFAGETDHLAYRGAHKCSQVYKDACTATWKVGMHVVDEIFALVEEEMHFTFL